MLDQCRRRLANIETTRSVSRVYWHTTSSLPFGFGKQGWVQKCTCEDKSKFSIHQIQIFILICRPSDFKHDNIMNRK